MLELCHTNQNYRFNLYTSVFNTPHNAVSPNKSAFFVSCLKVTCTTLPVPLDTTLYDAMAVYTWAMFFALVIMQSQERGYTFSPIFVWHLLSNQTVKLCEERQMVENNLRTNCVVFQSNVINFTRSLGVCPESWRAVAPVPWIYNLSTYHVPQRRFSTTPWNKNIGRNNNDC